MFPTAFTRIFKSLAIFALLLLPAIGCVRNTQPILKDEQITQDDSVVGKWVSTDGKNTFDISAPAADSKDYKVTYADEHQKKGNFQVRLGKVGDLLIAEIRPEEPAPDASDVYKATVMPLFTFMVIDQTKPQLIVSMLSSDWLKKYTEDHPTELAIARLKSDDFIVTASTEDFQAFFLKHYKEPGAMNDKTIFVHPGDPAIKP